MPEISNDSILSNVTVLNGRADDCPQPTTMLSDSCQSVLNTDLEAALAADYDLSGLDVQALTVVVPPPPPTWESGLVGTPRELTVGDNSGVLAIVTGMFVLMMLSYRYCRRLFKVLFHELLGMRRRANVFDERTSNETQVLGLMALQWSVYTGLLLYSFIDLRFGLSPGRIFVDALSLIGLMAVYYVVQIMAYSVVGYTFKPGAGQRYFVQGFTSSQSLLGFTLVVPALVAIFYPDAAWPMIQLSAGLYLLARLIFIIKGFRIFYDKFSSLLYFILYLCTLEIIPLIVLYNTALSIVGSR